MINLLDQTIETVLNQSWRSTLDKPSIEFTVPDEEWRNRVRGSAAGVHLNVYLYELRENRDFRRAEWDMIVDPDARMAGPAQPPAYIDCNYLVSAWSAAEDT